jgi:hypothetical protein
MASNSHILIFDLLIKEDYRGDLFELNPQVLNHFSSLLAVPSVRNALKF